MLRIVSFALDYHWRQATDAQTVRQSLDVLTKADIQPEDYRKRVSTSLPENEYSLLNFVAYCLYPPLYIAGPIITFNDFIWQVRLIH